MKRFFDPRRIRILATATLLICPLLSACAGRQQRPVSSATLPGNPIIAYPNSNDRTWTSELLSNPYVTQAGVNGRVLTIWTFHHNALYADQLTLDLNGNLGIRGSLSSLSSRSQKYDISPYKENALDLLHGVNLVTYRYRGETKKDTLHIGFIAEDTPSELSGVGRNSINLDNSVAVTMSATKQLDDQVRRMQTRIDALERKIDDLQSKRK